MEWRSIHSNSQRCTLPHAGCTLFVAEGQARHAAHLNVFWHWNHWDLNGPNLMPQRHAQRFSTFQHCSVACWGIFRQCRLFACNVCGKCSLRCNVWTCLWEAYLEHFSRTNYPNTFAGNAEMTLDTMSAEAFFKNSLSHFSFCVSQHVDIYVRKGQAHRSVRLKRVSCEWLDTKPRHGYVGNLELQKCSKQSKRELKDQIINVINSLKLPRTGTYNQLASKSLDWY